MKKIEILVIDDEQVVRDLFKRYLESLDYAVSTARDGVEAITQVREKDFDLILLDLKMPQMGGMEALAQIRSLNKEAVIIMLTAFATIDTAKEAIKQGCFDYLSKPFSLGEVRLTIERALRVRDLSLEKSRLEEQLRISEKLASLAQMGAGVAHEVNTVLASVKLFLGMLKPGVSLEAKDREDTDLMTAEIERAEKLIARFLNFAKPAEPEFVSTDINGIIRRSLKVFQPRIGKADIRIEERLDDTLPPVVCDPIKLEEVFLNVFANSLDAMSGPGTLSVKDRKEEDTVVIEVRDTGIGIPAENLNKVFDPFFTTKAHGTGLGLSIVHRIVDEHWGTLQITSGQDKGTVVLIQLPLTQD